MARLSQVHGIVANGASYSDTYGLTFEDFYGAIVSLVIGMLIVMTVVYACVRSASRQGRGETGSRSRASRGRCIGTCSWCRGDVYSGDDVVGGATSWSGLYHARCQTEMIVVLDL